MPASPRSLMMSRIGRILPDASFVSTPSSASTFCASRDGLTSEEMALRNAVPAIVPCKPALPRAPTAAVMSSILCPDDLATGATYFIASPSWRKSVFEDVNAFTRTSFAWASSPTSSPKPRRMFDVMFAAVPISSVAAAASCNTDGIERVISDTEKPDIARYDIAFAASLAEKRVVAPSSRACAVRAFSSPAVAAEIAPTRDICASKSVKSFAASVPNATSGAVKYIDIDLPNVSKPATFCEILPRASSTFFPPPTSESSRSLMMKSFAAIFCLN